MCRRMVFRCLRTSETATSTLPNPTPRLRTLIPKPLKEYRNKDKKLSTRMRPYLTEPSRNISFEGIVERDKSLQFLIRSKIYLSAQPGHLLRLDRAAKLNRELGFRRHQNVSMYLENHSLLFKVYRFENKVRWMGFTRLMKHLLQEEAGIMNTMELDRVTRVRKLLMMTKNKRISLSKLFYFKKLFGLPEDFKYRVLKYPEFFRVVQEGDRKILELAKWDSSLAVSVLDREVVVDMDKVKRAFRFGGNHSKDLDLDEARTGRLLQVSTLPLVSPYSDGSKLDKNSMKAEKYRVLVMHELLNLTLEKRATKEHVLALKEELCLTSHNYTMLKKQPWSFYLAGTEMNWEVFLKDGYDKNGFLVEKDPQVAFNEKLYNYAAMGRDQKRNNFL